MEHLNIVQVDYHHVVVAPPVAVPVPDFADIETQILHPVGTSGFAVTTTIAMGPVRLEVVDGVEPEEWPEHDSIEIELGESLVVQDFDESNPERAHRRGFFAPESSGRYRVDICARRRKKDWDRFLKPTRRRNLEHYVVTFTLLDAHAVEPPAERLGPSEFSEPSVVFDELGRLVLEEPIIVDPREEWPELQPPGQAAPDGGVFVVHALGAGLDWCVGERRDQSSGVQDDGTPGSLFIAGGLREATALCGVTSQNADFV